MVVNVLRGLIEGKRIEINTGNFGRWWAESGHSLTGGGIADDEFRIRWSFLDPWRKLVRSDFASVAAGEQGVFIASRGFAALGYEVSAPRKSAAGKQKCMAPGARRRKKKNPAIAGFFPIPEVGLEPTQVFRPTGF